MKGIKTKVGALALCGALLLGGCGSLKADAALLTADGKDTISVGVGNFSAKYSQASMEVMFGSYMGDDYWTGTTEDDGKTPEETTKDSVIDDLKARYVCEKHASEYGVELSDADRTSITETAKKFMDSNDEEGLQKLGASQEILEEYLTGLTYLTRVREAYYDQADITVSDEEAVQSSISYVHFTKEVEESEEYTEDLDEWTEITDAEMATWKAYAESVSTAEDFEGAVTGTGFQVETYTYTASSDPKEDEVVGEEVVAAAQKLKDGEVSAPIEADDGYYVVRMDKANDEEATDSKREELLKEKQQTQFNEQLDTWKSEVKWTLNGSQWKLVKFDSKFTQLPTATEETEGTEETTEDTESTEETTEDTESTEESDQN